MFIVKQRHKDAFAKTADEGFEDQMVIHLRQRFPAECEELGDSGVRRRIRDGIKRAARYEIRAERDLTRLCWIWRSPSTSTSNPTTVNCCSSAPRTKPE